MAKGLYDGPLTKDMDFTNPVGDGRPASGLAVQNYIKEIDSNMQDMDSAKIGVGYTADGGARHLFFATEADRDAYIEDPSKTYLIKDSIQLEALYRMEIELLSDENNIIFLGDKGSVISYRFKTYNKNDVEIPESVTATYTFTNGSIVKTVSAKYNAGTTVEFNVDDYILQGRNDILIELTGHTSKASTSSAVVYQVINLQLNDTMDISKVYRPNSGLADDAKLNIPYTVSGVGYKVMEWWIDGEKLPFNRQEDEINEATSSRTKYIDIIGLGQGRHSVQFRVSILVNSQTYYSNIHYREFIVSLDQSGDPIIVTATDFPANVSPLGVGDPLVIYPNQYETYNLRLGVYNPSGAYQNNVTASVSGVALATVSCLTGQESTVSITFTDEGSQTLLLSIDEYHREIGMDVVETELDIHEITNGLQLNFTGEGKNNLPTPDRDSWTGEIIIPGGSIVHNATLHGFDWTDVSGWVDNQLIIPSGAHIDFDDMKPLGNNPTGNGTTIEIDFKTINVEDENAVLIDLTDDNTGASVKLTATEVFVKSSESWTISRRYKTDEDLRVSIVINPKSGNLYAGMVFVYFNGILSMVQNYAKTASFVVNKFLSIGGTGAGIKVRQVRIYNDALESDDIVNNYILYQPTSNQMLNVYQRNDLYNSDGTGFDLNKIASFLPVMVITGDLSPIENATDTKATTVVDIDYTNLQDPTYSFRMYHAQMRPQGTSSLTYPRKNLRLYTRKRDDTVVYDYEGNVIESRLYSFKPKAQPVDCWTIKADFAESSSTHNTGVARIWNEVMKQAQLNGEYVLRTRAQECARLNDYPYDVRTTVDGFPIVIFWHRYESDPLTFLGKYNFNNDKSTESVFGFCEIPGFDNTYMNCWEFRDSGYNLALFKTPDNGRTYEQEFDYYATTMEGKDWKMNEVWESRYPNVNDLTTDVSELKRLALWINSTEGAAVWDNNPASPTYNTLIIGDETKFNKWQTEKTQHFDLPKLAAYYVYLIRFGAVDQTVKNAMMTTEDGDHWYFINYDNDTILGVRNDGLLKYGPEIDRTTWDAQLNDFAYAGHNSVLWNNFEADPECMAMVKSIDSALFTAGLTYDGMIQMFNVDQAGKWAEKVYNNDALYKYIDPFIYQDKNYLGSLQGSRSDHRKWWISNRFSTYDAIYANSAYENNAITLLMPGAPNTSTFSIESGKDTYYGWGQNRVPVETGVYVEHDQDHTFTLAGGADTWPIGTPLRIYAPNYIKTLDLSASMQYIGSNFNLSAAYSETLGSNMKSLILGVDNVISDTRRNIALASISGLNTILTLENINVAGFEAMSNLDISNLSNLKTFKAYASGLNSVAFANGAPLNSIELPVALQSLTLNSLPNLTMSGIHLEPYYPSDTSDPNYGKTGINIRDISISNCPNISNSPSLIFDWLENKITADSFCSVYMNNVAWGDETPLQASELQKLIDFVDNGGSLELIGHANITEISSPEFAEELQRVFGEHVFEPSASFYIIAPPTIFLTGPTEVLEGHTAQYDVIIVGETSSYETDWSLINAGDRASISNSGLLTTVENGYSSQQITVRVMIDFGSGMPEIRNKNVNIIQCTYPSSGDVTITGPSSITPGTPISYTVHYENEESITGEMIGVWEVTGDMTQYKYTTITSTTVDEYGNPSGCTMMMSTPEAGVIIVTGKIQLTLKKKNRSGQPTLFPKTTNIVYQNDSIAVTKTTNPYAMAALYAGLHDKGKCEHEDYMTKREAYTVTSDDLMNGSNSIFYNNSNFRNYCTSFDEFQYFIGVGELNRTFYQCSKLKSVIIPNGVLTIGTRAFNLCGIQSISIPNTVTTIGSSAFYQCGKLESVIIPDSVQIIGETAFSNCSKLNSISIGSGVTTMGQGAFQYCNELTTVNINCNIPNSCFYTNNSASPFYGCRNIKSINLSEGITTIENNAFYEVTSLTSPITIPSTVTTIGPVAFAYCTGIQGKLILPQGLTTLGGAAFSQCPGITGELVIPNSLTSIEDTTFNNCTGITSVSIPNTIQSIKANAFQGCTGLTGELIIPSSVGEIRASAFNGCTGITSVKILGSGTSGTVLYDGSIFKNCTGLTTVEMSCNVPSRAFDSSYDGGVFYNCPVRNVILNEGVQTIGGNAFSNCSWLDSISLPSSVRTIEGYAFQYTPLTSISLPYSLTSLSGGAFRACSDLTTVDVYSRSISTYFDPNNTSSPFYSCNKLKHVNLHEGVEYIGSYAFNNCSWLDSISIPSTVQYIEGYAFGNCTGLESISLPNSVTHFGNWAFVNCTGLTTIEMSCDVPSRAFGDGQAFSGCVNVTNVILNEGVSAIGEAAFSNYKGNISANLPSTITSIARQAFHGCAGLTGKLIIPEGVETINDNAFYNCTGLTGELVIPEGVKAINTCAFMGCTKIDSLSISSTVTSIASDAFTHLGSEHILDDSRGLKHITVASDNQYFTDGNGKDCLEQISNHTLILGCNNSVIPTDVINIGDYAFSYCDITSITISENVSNISNTSFWYCSNIEHITVDSNNGYYSSDGFDYIKQISNNYIVLGCKNSIISSLIKGFEQNCFRGCSGLGPDLTINLPYGNGIRPYAFYDCTGLINVVVTGMSSTTIDSSAFRGCTNLVNLQVNTYSISGEAFANCTSLKSLNIGSTINGISGSSFSGCSSLESITVDANNSKYRDDDSNCIISNSDNSLVVGCKNSIIPNSVTSIGSYAFSGRTGLTSITISNNINSIGSYAFQGCTGLTSINFEDRLENNCNIYSNAFAGCTGLTSVTIPTNYTLNSQSFSECTGLTSVTFHKTVPIYALFVQNSSSPFFRCENIKNVILNDDVTYIGTYAFVNCEWLTSISIPQACLEIQSNTFLGCTGLTSVTFHDSMTSIGNYAFQRCTGLTSIAIPSSITSLGDGAFAECTNLATITCQPTTPPSIQSNTLPGIQYVLNIYVPSESVNTYKGASNWSTYAIRISAING